MESIDFSWKLKLSLLDIDLLDEITCSTPFFNPFDVYDHVITRFALAMRSSAWGYHGLVGEVGLKP